MSRSSRAAVAFAWGFVVAVALYACVRAIQFVFFPEPNPATLVWSAHSGFFWRCWTVTFAGGIGAFVAWLVPVERAARGLPAAVAVAAALIALQAIALP